VHAEIVSVGTELLLGQIANTNARWMSERLAEIGVDVLRHTTVGDNLERIVTALDEAAARAKFVLVTGGLGPTGDDLTRDALAEVLGVPLERDLSIEASLRERFASLGRSQMPVSNLRQADVPIGAEVITPRIGSAPGLIASTREGTVVYAMPGVPAEMREMVEGTVVPALQALAGPGAVRSRVVRCTGIGESRVAELLADLFETSTNPTVAYLAGAGEVKVRLTAKAVDAEAADALLVPLTSQIVARLGDVVFSASDESLEEVVVDLLTSAGRTLACAESLTGGGVGERLSRVPGASACFVGSAVVYSADAKRMILGIRRATIEGPGPVSEACVREMAAGARERYGADIGLALTGVAGPARQGGVPPGTVWLGLSTPDVDRTRLVTAAGTRDQVRGWATRCALDLLRRYLAGLEIPTSNRLI
jgi:nicotinamide-nucleotide amidase